jgi:hypothetical protein
MHDPEHAEIRGVDPAGEVLLVLVTELKGTKASAPARRM